MRSVFITSVFAAAFMTWLQSAAAHHSFAPALTEDGEEVIEIFEGSIEIYKLLNPHTALIVNAINESGAVEDWLPLVVIVQPRNSLCPMVSKGLP